MTAIVGYTDGATMVVGADSLSTSGCEAIVLPDPKVWRAGDVLMGAAGSLRALQVARYGLCAPSARSGDVVPMEGLYRWANDYRNMLHTLRTPVDGKDDPALYVLIGWRGAFYEVQGSGGIVSFPGAIGATGCGGPEARAAIWALIQPLPSAYVVGFAPRLLVQRGLEAAAAFNTHVRGPFHYVEMAL